jgi:hypothetical protein
LVCFLAKISVPKSRRIRTKIGESDVDKEGKEGSCRWGFYYSFVFFLPPFPSPKFGFDFGQIFGTKFQENPNQNGGNPPTDGKEGKEGRAVVGDFILFPSSPNLVLILAKISVPKSRRIRTKIGESVVDKEGKEGSCCWGFYCISLLPKFGFDFGENFGTKFQEDPNQNGGNPPTDGKEGKEGRAVVGDFILFPPLPKFGFDFGQIFGTKFQEDPNQNSGRVAEKKKGTRKTIFFLGLYSGKKSFFLVRIRSQKRQRSDPPNFPDRPSKIRGRARNDFEPKKFKVQRSDAAFLGVPTSTGPSM